MIISDNPISQNNITKAEIYVTLKNNAKLGNPNVGTGTQEELLYYAVDTHPPCNIVSTIYRGSVMSFYYILHL